jgi:hypothetical protein
VNYSIELKTFVNDIFQVVLFTLPSAFTGEDFVVSSVEWIGEEYYTVKSAVYLSADSQMTKESLELV